MIEGYVFMILVLIIRNYLMNKYCVYIGYFLFLENYNLLKKFNRIYRSMKKNSYFYIIGL